MSTLVIPTSVMAEIRSDLFATADEACAVLLTRQSATAIDVVRESIRVPDAAYKLRSPAAAELSSSFVFEVAERARAIGAGLTFVHSHLQTGTSLQFSGPDDAGEQRLKPYLTNKLPGRMLSSLIFTPTGCRAREMCGPEIRVKEVGETIRYLFEPDAANQADYNDIYDRQVRVFGAPGQRLVARTKVGIVGLGGTGSVVAQELAYLGVQSFVFVDHQELEETNRNRVVGSESTDVGRLKVEVAQRLAQRTNFDVQIELYPGSVLDPENREPLAKCDFIFICTDNHASRLELCNFCYERLIPAIDIGVSVSLQEKTIDAISGRIQMISPGLPCLLCTQSIDSNAIRRETMPAAHREADPYFDGDGEPQPAVISFNATVSSLAVSMFVAAVTGMPIKARHLRYDGITSSIRPLTATGHPSCIICSTAGALGAGKQAFLV